MAATGLSLFEREEIRVGIARNETDTAIAKRLGRARSTVSREIDRNGGREVYIAAGAHRRARLKRRRPKVPKLLCLPALGARVSEDLRWGYSPAAIAERLRRDGGARVAAETIYQSIYSKTFAGVVGMPSQRLRTRRSRRKPHNRWRRPFHLLRKAKLIDERPAEAMSRLVPGHWEGDLVMGAQRTRSGVVTLVERTTRFTQIMATDDPRDPSAVRAALMLAMSRVPPHLRSSLTWDQGLEMYEWRYVQCHARVPIYFCHPRSPWERPSNENTNRHLRFWLPKGTNLGCYSQRDLDEIAAVWNDHPRRSLGWDTPAERYAVAAVH